MTSEQPRRGALGRFLWLFPVGVAFALVAPIGMFTVPLAAQVFVSHPKTRAELLTGSLAGGASLAWLLQIGDPAEQLVRAAVLLATAIFVGLGLRTSWSATHRSLMALAAAVVAVSLLALVAGGKWAEVRWWVEYNLGFVARLTAWLWLPPASTEGGGAAEPELVPEALVPVLADVFPAVQALLMLLGFAFATAIYRRVTPTPVGTSRFRDFRFSEHVGWAAVVSLAVVLLSRSGTARLLAINILVVTGCLYALRGVAVAAFGLSMGRTNRFVAGALFAVAFLFLLPVALPAAIVLGVVDTGVDLRTRWIAPRERS